MAARQRVPPRRRSPFRFDHGIMCAAYCRSRCSCPYPAHPSPPPQPSAAFAVLSRKRYFGSQCTSFMAAVVRAASAPDGTFADNSRLTCLRCVNNFLCLRQFQFEAAFQAQEFLAPLVSSATSANEDIRSEWVLLLRNMASALHSCRPDGFEQHTHFIAASLLQILHAPQGPHLSSSVQCNGTLGLGTCLHILKSSPNGIKVVAAFAVEAKAALLHVESGCMASDSLPTGIVAREALQLLNDIAAADPAAYAAAVQADNNGAKPVFISGATGYRAAAINGPYSPTQEKGTNGRIKYSKDGDASLCIEHFAGKWQVKPVSGKGVSYGSVQGGCALEYCASRAWNVGDNGKWTEQTNVKIVTGAEAEREVGRPCIVYRACHSARCALIPSRCAGCRVCRCH